MRWEDFTGWLRRRLDPVQFGFAEALGAVVVTALAFTLVFAVTSFPAPSVELLRGLADLGMALFIGYIVESTWLARHDKGELIGALVAFAIAGLVGIVLSLLLAEHRAAGHSNLLDDIGLAWIATSYLFLGLLLVAFPWFAWERWKSGGETSGPTPRGRGPGA